MTDSKAWKAARAVLATLSCAIAASALATEPIASRGAAIEAAKRYTRARCAEVPCKYRAEHEGRQWRVWVQLGKRSSRGPARQIILFFDHDGNLIRRIEGE
jgi:hypothetical protein